MGIKVTKYPIVCQNKSFILVHVGNSRESNSKVHGIGEQFKVSVCCSVPRQTALIPGQRLYSVALNEKQSGNAPVYLPQRVLGKLLRL